MIRRNSLTLTAIAALCATATVAQAEEVVDWLVIDIDGWQSVGPFGDPANTSGSWDIGAGSIVVGVSWDLEIQTFGGSLASEAFFAFTSTSLAGFAAQLAPVAAPLPNPTHFTGSVNLVSMGLDFAVDEDGLFHLESLESTSTLGGAVEAEWNGTITLDYKAIPAPGALALLGIAGLVGRGRRRRG